MTEQQTHDQTVVGAVIVDNLDRPTQVLVGRRSGKHAGFWEFPGGKVEPGEPAESGLVREVREELGVTVAVASEVDPARGGWEISPALVLKLYIATVIEGAPRAGDSHDCLQWTTVEKLADLDWLGADRAALPVVIAQLHSR